MILNDGLQGMQAEFLKFAQNNDYPVQGSGKAPRNEASHPSDVVDRIEKSEPSPSLYQANGRLGGASPPPQSISEFV